MTLPPGVREKKAETNMTKNLILEQERTKLQETGSS